MPCSPKRARFTVTEDRDTFRASEVAHTGVMVTGDTTIPSAPRLQEAVLVQSSMVREHSGIAYARPQPAGHATAAEYAVHCGCRHGVQNAIPFETAGRARLPRPWTTWLNAQQVGSGRHGEGDTPDTPFAAEMTTVLPNTSDAHPAQRACYGAHVASSTHDSTCPHIHNT